MPRPFAVIGFTVFFTLSILNQLNTGATVVAFAVYSAALVISLLLKRIREAKVIPLACVSGILACAFLICSNVLIYQPIADYAGKTCDLTARIKSEPSINYGNYYYDAEAISLDGQDADFDIRLTFSTVPDAEAFDIIEGKFTLYLPGASNEDYLSANKAKGLYIAAYPSTEGYTVYDSQADNVIEEKIFLLRKTIKQAIYRTLPNEYGGLAVALILGDKSGMLAETLSDFNIIGISHLISVSGFHLSLLTMIIMGIFNALKLNKKLAAVISAVFVFLFMLITGFSFSVMRSGIVMFVYLGSILLSRNHDSLNSLGFAVTVIALLNPFSIGAVGLQLSVLSSLGLILYFQLLQPRIFKKLDEHGNETLNGFIKPVLSVMAVTAAAVAFTLPITLNINSGFNFAVFIANLFTVTASSFCIVLCAIGALINIFFPNIFNLPAFTGGIICKYLTEISSKIADWTYLSFKIEIDKAYIIVCGILLICAFSVLLAYLGKSMPIRTVLICVLVFNIGLFGFTVRKIDETEFKILDVGKGTAVLISHDNENILIGCGGTLYSGSNKITDAVFRAGNLDCVIVPSNKESDSSFIVPLLLNSKVDKICSNELPSGAELLTENIDNCSLENGYVSDKVKIISSSVNGKMCFLVETEDVSALICCDPIERLSELPAEFLKADIVICRGDYPDDIEMINPDTVIINDENTRGLIIQNELISMGVYAAATAECGNVILRADNGDISLYRE